VHVTAWLSALLLVGLLLLEVVLRRGVEARSWEAGEDDRSSTRLIVVTYVVAFIAPLALGSAGAGATRTDSLLAWIGIALGGCGLAVRIWSMRVLGSSYTRSLRTTADQTIVDSGPYRVIRHPGYLGSILVWTGSRLALNWLVAIATVVVLGGVYAYRINAEERMLIKHFGSAYDAYKAHTWRLVPYVW